jgi:hypothetical protein
LRCALTPRAQADAPAPAGGDEAAPEAPGGDDDAGEAAGVPGEDPAAKAARKASRRADLETLRAMKETHTLKELAESPLAVKHGWTSKDKLKDALRVRPRSGPDSAARAKAERATRGPLTEEMLAEIKRRLASGESLADIRKSEACGGVLRLFPLDLLRRRANGAAVRTHQCRTAVEYKGMTMLKSGKYQVQYKKRYVGLFATAELAAAAWNAAATADGVPAEQLNVLRAAGAAGAGAGAAMVDAGNDGAEEEDDAADDVDGAAVM